MTLAFSPAALADLDEIAVYIALDNPARALRFVDELERHCKVLAAEPGLGTARPELGRGIRMLPHQRYLVFYRRTAGGVRIERVLHGSRDVRADDIGVDDDFG